MSAFCVLHPHVVGRPRTSRTAHRADPSCNAQAVLHFRRAQPLERLRQRLRFEILLTPVQPERLRTGPSPRVEVHPLRLQAEVRADAVRYVVDEEFARTPDAADLSPHRFVQVVEGPAAPEVRRQETVPPLLQYGSRNTALVRVALPTGSFDSAATSTARSRLGCEAYHRISRSECVWYSETSRGRRARTCRGVRGEACDGRMTPIDDFCSYD